MILEMLISFFCDFILGLLEMLDIISLPLDAIEVLHEFFVYGSYIVGHDILIIFGSLVFGWTIAKLTVGIGIRVWEMLPFT